MAKSTLRGFLVFLASSSLFACDSGSPADSLAPGADGAAPDASGGANDGGANASGGGKDAGRGDAAMPVEDGSDSADAAAAPVKALGYYTGTQTSYVALQSFHAYMNMVSLDVFSVRSDGSITGDDGLGARAYAAGRGIDAFACVSNYNTALGDFDPALAHDAMVTHEGALVSAAVDLAATGYRGLNVDFEGLTYSTTAEARTAYTAFIVDLGKSLHARGLELVISVPAKTTDDAGDTWGYPFDFAALGPHVDYVQLMTYDEHGPGWSGPGSVSGAPWVESSVAYAASLLPPSKILIGLPAYGYDWDLTASNPGQDKYVGASVAWTEIPAILARPGATKHWDATTSSPYADYTADDGHQHQVWFEDPQSIKTKSALVPKYRLGGLSMWAVGDEDLSFWQAAYAGLL